MYRMQVIALYWACGYHMLNTSVTKWVFEFTGFRR